MIITTDPRPPARLAPLRPPGCPASEVPTGRHAAPDENIHDGVCLKARRLPSIRLNSPTSRSKNQTEQRQMNRHVIFTEDANFDPRSPAPDSPPRLQNAGWRLRSSRDHVGADGPLRLKRGSRATDLTGASRLIEQKLQAAFQEWRRCRITTFPAW